MFVDELTVKLMAGNGGDGCTSFRREKYIPMGGPDGGNGGRGSNIIFKVDENLKTLIDLRYQKIIKGSKGNNGKGNNRYGANAEDVYISIPAGTTVINEETGKVLADLITHNEEFVVAKGGRGGRGNKSFSTHENPAPKFSEKGEPGEEIIVRLELKVLADVGLVGMPSVGKSTILSLISASKPKIAAYHFTTLSPNLGVVKLKDHRKFVIADLPGLIEGASKGVGLGDEFLKHAMRTRVIAHVIDMGAMEGRNPIDDYKIIRKELDEYNEFLSNKKELVIANKMDLENGKSNLEKFKKEFPNIDVVEISAINNEGLENLLVKLADLVDSIPKFNLYENEADDFVVYKFDANSEFQITREDNIWKVSGKEVEKLFKMTRFEETEGVMRFARKLKGLGIEDELEKMGAQPGDEVQILDYLFIFKG